jgi:hypothetical protein
MSQGGPVISVAFEAEIAQLQGKMNQAKAVVEKTARDMGAVVDKNNLAQRFFRREQAVFALNAIGNAAKFVGESMSALRAGDWDRVVQAVETLPFGLGQVAQGIHLVVDELSGYREEAERSSKLLAEQADRLKRAEAVMAVREEISAASELLGLQRQLVEATSEEAKNRINATMAMVQAEQDIARRRRSAKSTTGQNLDSEFDANLEARMALEGLKYRKAEEERKKNEAESRERSRVRSIFEQAAARRERRLDELKSEEERLSARGGASARDFLTTQQTALGAFTSGNTAMASRTMLEQLNTQKRLVQIAEEQRDILDDLKVINQGGWQ